MSATDDLVEFLKGKVDEIEVELVDLCGIYLDDDEDEYNLNEDLTAVVQYVKEIKTILSSL